MLDEKNKEPEIIKKDSLNTTETPSEVVNSRIKDTFAIVDKDKNNNLEFTIQRLSELKWLQTHYETLGLGSWSEVNIKIEKLSQVRYDELHEYMPILHLLPIEDHQTISFEVTGVKASAFKIDKVTKMSEFNSKLALLDQIDAGRSADILYSISFKAPDVDNKEVTHINYAFKGNTHLKQLDILSEFKEVNSAKSTFEGCENLKFVNGIAFLPKVTDTTSMFKDCISLENPTDEKGVLLSTLNVSGLSQLTTAKEMFSGCSLLSDIDGLSSWIAAEDITNIFSNCKKLNNLSCKLPTVINAIGAFTGCTSLTTFKDIDFSQLDNATSMFMNCTSLPTLDISTFQNVTNSSHMFEGCKSFVIEDEGDISKAYLKPLVDNTNNSSPLVNASCMFKDCTSIISIDIRGLLALSNIDFSHLFENCTGLTTIYWGSKHPTIEEPRNRIEANVEKYKDMLKGTTALSTINVNDENKDISPDKNLASNGLHSIIWIAHRLFKCDEKEATLDDATTELGDLGVSRVNFYNYNFIIDASSYPIEIPLNELWIWQNIIEPDATVSTYKLMVRKVTTRGIHNTIPNGHSRGDLSLALKKFTGNFKFKLSFEILKTEAETENFNFDNSFEGDEKIYSVTPSIEGTSSEDLPIQVETATSMFKDCKSLYSFPNLTDDKKFEKINFDFMNAKSMFENCKALELVDTSKFLNLINATSMFRSSGIRNINCSGFTEVTECEKMFMDCDLLDTVIIKYNKPGPDGTITKNGFSEVKNATQMFSGCSLLSNIADARVFENVTNIDRMFENCSSLSKLNVSTMTKVTDAVAAFKNCINLTDLGDTNFENLKVATQMFSNCKQLKEDQANLLQFISVETADSMFEGCTSFTSADLSSFGASDYSVMNDKAIQPNDSLNDTLYLKNSQTMFSGCSSLETIKLGFTYKKLTSFTDMFKDISPNPKFRIQSKFEKEWLKEHWIELGLPGALEDGKLETITIEEMSFNFYMTEYLSVITSDNIYKDFQLKNVAEAEICQQKDGSFNPNYFSGTFDAITAKLEPSPFNKKFIEEISIYKKDLNTYKLSFDLPSFNDSKKASVTTLDYCIYGNSKIKVINFILKDTQSLDSQVISANHAFEGCANLTYTDTCMFDKVQYANCMFKDCIKLNATKEVDTINVENFKAVTDASSMFENCNAISIFNNNGLSFSSTKYANKMFKDCIKLKKVNTFECFSKVVNATSMFENCEALEEAKLEYFTSILNVDRMLKNCKSILVVDVVNFCRNLSELDESPSNYNIIQAKETFFGCSKLNTVNHPRYLCKVRNAEEMFKGCEELGKRDDETSHLCLYKAFIEKEYNTYDENFTKDFANININTHEPFENIRNARSMFEDCKNLTEANLTYARKLQNTNSMFKGCNRLFETQIDTFYQNPEFTPTAAERVDNYKDMYMGTDPSLVFNVKRFTERSWIIDNFESLTGKALSTTPEIKASRFKTLSFKYIPYRNLCEYFPIIDKNENNTSLIIIQINDLHNLTKNKYAEAKDFYVEVNDISHSVTSYNTGTLYEIGGANDAQLDLLDEPLTYEGTDMNGRQKKGKVTFDGNTPHCSWFGSQFIWFETLDSQYDDIHKLSSDLRRSKNLSIPSSMGISLNIALDGDIGNNLESISYCFNDLTNIFDSIKITYSHTEGNKLKYGHGAFRNVNTLVNCDTSIFQFIDQCMSTFEGCKSLSTISSLYFKNVLCAYRMFKGSGINSLFELGNHEVFAQTMLASEMFMDCDSLQTVDTRNFTNVIQAESMFNNCSTLTHLSLEKFTKVENVKEMVKDCTKLNSISISKDHQKRLSEIAVVKSPEGDETAYKENYPKLFGMFEGTNDLSYIAVEDASSKNDVMKIAKWYYKWRKVLKLYMEYVSFTNSLKIVFKFCAGTTAAALEDIVPENRYIKGYTDIDGKVNLNHSQYLDDADGVLNLNNSNIYNINGLHFGRSDRLGEGTDPSDPTKDPKKKIVFAKGSEGIQFDRNDGDADNANKIKGKADSFWNDSNGGLFYSPNRTFEHEADANRMIESKHFNSSITSGFVDTIYSDDGSNLNTQVIPNNTDYNKNGSGYSWQITSVDYIIEK